MTNKSLACILWRVLWQVLVGHDYMAVRLTALDRSHAGASNSQIHHTRPPEQLPIGAYVRQRHDY